tara:strand:- start:1297 stop:1746 length:450 start_codon:yes stop_codon:yes gene_type:complete
MTTTTNSELLVSNIVAQLGDLLNLYTSSKTQVVELEEQIASNTTTHAVAITELSASHAAALAAEEATHQSELTQVATAAAADIETLQVSNEALHTNYQAQLEVKDDTISALQSQVSALEADIAALISPENVDTPDNQTDVMNKLGIEHA